MSGCDSQIENDKTNKNVTLKKTESTQNYTLNDLFGKEVPIPDDAKVKNNTFVITGKNPNDIIYEYLKMLSDNGWKQVTAMGMKRFYEKEINGNVITISVLSMQEGGLQEKNIETVIQFKIEKRPYKLKKE